MMLNIMLVLFQANDWLVNVILAVKGIQRQQIIGLSLVPITMVK